MLRTLLLSSLAFWLNFSTPSAQPDSDYQGIVLRNRIEFSLAHDQGLWRLDAEYEFTRSCQSDESVKTQPFLIFVPDYAPVDGISLYRNGRSREWGQSISVPVVFGGSFLSDARAHVVGIPEALDPGDSLVVCYRQSYDDLFFTPAVPVENNDYLDSLEVTFWHPPDVTVDFDVCYGRDSFPYTIDRPDDSTTRLLIAAVPPAKDLVYFGLNKLHGVILPVLRQGGKPLNPISAEDFIRAYLARMRFDRTYDQPLPPALSAQLEEQTTARRKLETIHQYVCSTLRYLADDRRTSGIFPHDPDFVDSLGYGDCKDRAGLVTALANRAGIGGLYVALVTTEPRIPMPGVHMSQFNHVICAWRDGDSLLFFDPTAPRLPFGVLPEVLIGRTALVLDSVTPERVVIQQTPPEPSLECDITGNLNSLGEATAEVIVRYDMMAWALTQRFELGAELRSDSVRAELMRCFPTVGMSHLMVTDTSGGSMRLTGTADLTDFVIDSPTRRYLPVAPLGGIANDVLKRADDSLMIDYRGWYDVRLRIHLQAAGVQVTPDSTSYGEPLTGAYTTKLVPGSNGKIDLSYHLVRRRAILAGAEKQRHLDFVRRYLNAKSGVYILEREQQ